MAVAEAIYGLAEIECPHDYGALIQQTVFQWMGENALLGPCIILRQDAAERCNLAEQ
jgi:hypothetical protein